MKHTVLTHPNPQLRVPAQLVDASRFGSAELKAFAEELADMMVRQDGVGLAATQLGVADRIIVVAMPDTGATVFVNPKIVSRSRWTFDFEEGCLSVPGVYGMVERHKKVKVKAYTVGGLPVTLSVKGLYAVVFQHEIDHLDGILFIDKVKRFTHGSNVRV